MSAGKGERMMYETCATCGKIFRHGMAIRFEYFRNEGSKNLERTFCWFKANIKTGHLINHLYTPDCPECKQGKDENHV
jgi:hypothetical protein